MESLACMHTRVPVCYRMGVGVGDNVIVWTEERLDFKNKSRTTM